jgi:hypothetical protein
VKEITYMNESTNNESSRLAPEAAFPEDLTVLESSEVAVLNSRVHRAMDSEYIRFGTADPETEARLAELTEELNRRDESSPEAAMPETVAEDTASGL